MTATRITMETKGTAVAAEARGQRSAWRQRRQLGKSAELAALSAWRRCRQQQRGGGSMAVAALRRWRPAWRRRQQGGSTSSATA